MNMEKSIRNALILSFCLYAVATTAQTYPLHIPDTLSGESIYLKLQHGQTTFIPGITTATMGANGDILGPTLFLQKGQFVSIEVENDLGEPTTIHWHGLHVASENDGGPHTPIAPGEIWNPQFTVLDEAATYWYHPHLHHKTNEHVSKGIAGMIIVRDSNEVTLNLPSQYGVDDIPVIIQTKELDAQNQITTHTHEDRLLLVNGTVDPFANVPAQWIRLRVLNGSSERSFNLGFADNMPFYQIASDAGLLNRPVSLSRLLLAPGERAELMVNLNTMEGRQVVLRSFSAELPNGIYGARFPGMGQGMVLNGYNPNPLNGENFDLLHLFVGAQTANPSPGLPAVLNDLVRWSLSDSDTLRTFVFMPEMMGPNQLNGHFMINNRLFEMEYINEVVTLGNTEIWELRNQSGIAHPFHLHNVPFFILDRNGVLPSENERGLKDVVLVRPGETVRIITRFTDFADSPVPYMYHCHLLTHEDDGMMGQFLVKSPATQNSVLADDGGFSLFPNPSSGTFRLSGGKPGLLLDVPFEVRDLTGGRMYSGMLDNGEGKLPSLPPGMYHILFQYNHARYVQKLLIR
jgi:FtsP/CotA-like multicopper oxidase with cupredoxin domain